MREALAQGIQEGRLAWASLLQQIDPDAEERKAWTVGSFYQALLSGILVQWLIEPRRAPSGHDLAEALRVIAAGVNRSPDSDLTAMATNTSARGRTIKRKKESGLQTRRTTANVRGRKKPVL